MQMLEQLNAERERAEQALRESEEQFRTLADSIPQLAWMADADGSIFWYNQRWYDYTGTTFEEMRGWGWQKVHHPEEVARVTARFKRAVAAGEPWEDTFPLKSKEGEFRRFLSRALPIHDAEGQVVRWFGTNTDIEEQLRAEERLQASEQHLRKVLDALFTFVGVMMPDGTLIEANRAALEAANLKPEDVIGKPFEQAYWWAYSSDVQQELREAIRRAAQGEIVRYDVPVRLAEDRFITIEFSLVPMLDAEGRVTHLIPSGTDITARKEAQSKLEATERRYSTLADAMPQLVWATDENGSSTLR